MNLLFDVSIQLLQINLRYLKLLMTMIGLLVLITIELSAQPAVDDSPSCENSTLDQTVKLITKGFTEVKKQFIQDLAEVKDLLGSCQQNCSAVSSSNLCEFIKVFRLS